MPIEFGPPDDEICQGDLFVAVPSLYVQDLSYMVKHAENEFHLEAGEQENRRDDRMYPANAVEARAPAIVVTHDCEIDKQTRKMLVELALVRPLVAPAVPEELHESFRANTRHRVVYLPPNNYLDGENYADLRRRTVLRGDTLLELGKLASMNEDGRRVLREQLFRFYTRRYLPDDWVDWDEDEQ